MLSTYSYDKLNRLKQDQPYTIVNNASTITSTWSSSYSYDPDGNITNLMRDDGNGSGIDNLSYVYPASGGKTINNRLNHIVDHTTGNGGGAGVVTQNPGNYSYDATGNLTADVTEGITSITWTPYNTIRELVKTNATPATGTTTLRYLYDATGNRVVKDYHATQNTKLTSRTWYTRDAQGTVLAIYTRKPTAGNNGSVTRTEAPFYGTSWIGQSTRTATYDATASGEATLPGTVYSRELGKCACEFVDHLGNVRATIGDIPIARTATNTYDADILTLTDYYPFGMQMETRTWEAGCVAGHRYGYNGKENDDEVKGQGNSVDFGARIYDPTIGSFIGVDLLCAENVHQSPFATFNRNPLLFVDPNGKSAEVAINRVNRTITVSASMVFYGDGASRKLAKQTARDVQNLWNEGAHSVMINGVSYVVKFKFQCSSDLNPTQQDMSTNRDIRKNFIRVESGNNAGVSRHSYGGNDGYFLLKNIARKGTTAEAHDMSHGWGLWPSPNDLGRSLNGDPRGQGEPGIIYPRGTIVDPQFQWNSTAAAGAPGGALNPDKRKVLQSDVDVLGLTSLIFNSNVRTNLGRLTNNYHPSEVQNQRSTP
jgi:RHS repeat-associated protein